MTKIIMVVIDGVSDGLRYRPTSLELANKPGLDALAKISIGGCFYPIDSRTAPESDAAVFSILGYDPREISIGRGLLEALGLGIKIVEGNEVVFRGNFATVDPRDLKIIDRRVGRSLSSEEAHMLAKDIEYIDLGLYSGYAKVYASIGHRTVVVIGSREKRLSANVSNTDPAYAKDGRLSIALKTYDPYIAPCRPLDNSEEARITCKLVDIFTKKVIEILDGHRVNIERQRRGLPKGNAILLRDAEDRYPSIKPIENLYGRKFGIVAEMPVERGIGALLGMEIATVSPPTGDLQKDYGERLEKTLELLNRVDVVYVHLKGPDEPGHDGDRKRKVASIEAIDRYYIQKLIGSIDLEKSVVIVTADHSTPPEIKAHSADPVPIIVASKRHIKIDGFTGFSEAECCSKGSLGIIPHGFMVLRKVFDFLSK